MGAYRTPLVGFSVAIFGMGTIAAHHAAALEPIDAVATLVGVDPDPNATLTFRGRPVERCQTTDPIDVAIVATPTPTHATVVDELFARGVERILVEKPMADNLADAHRLIEAGAETLYHAATAPEVEWAVQNLQDSVVAFDAFFGDGCHDIDPARASLGNAWLDLGINALSVLARFGEIEQLERTHADRARETYGARATFAGGRGSIAVTWGGLEPSKHTTLVLADDTRVMLDHQAGVASVDGRVRFAAPTDRPRLEQHYRALFARTLTNNPVFTREQERAIYALLFSGFGTITP
jgi:predicted dehydrogenase